MQAIRVGLLFALYCSLFCAAVPAPSRGEGVAVLRGLDKITARISTFDAPESKHVRFGTLRILVRVCNKRPPEETPETSVFLEIVDLRPGGNPVRVFTGWMFSSSPALSALEHPTYDVWVMDCRTVLPSSSVGSG